MDQGRSSNIYLILYFYVLILGIHGINVFRYFLFPSLGSDIDVARMTDIWLDFTVEIPKTEIVLGKSVMHGKPTRNKVSKG